MKDSAGTIRMTFIPKDKVKQLGVSEDRQGCNEAAGYTWSEVRKSCIRLFESGVQLTSVKDTAESLAAYIVFSADSLQAEVFVPNMDIHPILERRNLPNGRYAWNQEDDANFEDAIVISERIQREDIFTSVHVDEYIMEVLSLIHISRRAAPKHATGDRYTPRLLFRSYTDLSVKYCI